MNEKITLPELTAELAIASGRSKKLSEDFIREFFARISQTLATGESVRIKGIGTFKLSDIAPRKSVSVSTGEEVEIPSHRRITFIPAKELASAVNAGFEMFDAVELSDSVTEDMLRAAEDEIEASDVSVERQADNVLPVPEEEITDSAALDAEFDEAVERNMDEEIAEEKREQKKEAAAMKAHEHIENELMNASEDVAPECEEYSAPELKRSGRRFIWGWLLGFVSCAALIVIALFLMKFYSLPPFDNVVKPEAKLLLAAPDPVAKPEASADTTAKDTVELEKNKEEKEAAPATQPSDKKVYDTIGKTRYLTTMAKEHYGNYHLWPYIYEENKAFLGHPDRIRPGTKVVIPPLSKYGVDAHNTADIAKAKKMGAEIYSRYK